MSLPTIPTVTALYGSVNAIVNIALATRVSTIRRRDKVSLGTGDSQDLLVAVRTHGNSAEFVPLAIVTLLLCELCGGSSVILHVLGGSLLVARLLHVYGMPRPAPNVYRVISNVVTWGGIVATAAYTLLLRTRL
jgi:uncharacterized membrane protein YecN with MAPEG domain